MIQHFIKILFCCILSGLLTTLSHAQRQSETLNRGVVAVKKSSTQMYVSWRLFARDPAGIAFNLYRSANGGASVKLTASPISITTDYTDTPPNLSTTTYSYFIRPVINGVEQASSETATYAASTSVKQYLSVPLRNDTGPDGPYTVKFAWVGDLDGDGDYDYVVDRLSTLGEREQFLEAYTNEGVFLWRMSMGPNSINQYAYEPGSSAISVGDTDNVTVYDMDGDGRAEVMVRTANGVTVRSADGTVMASVTNATQTAQFVSVIDGLTGSELARAPVPNPWAQHGTLTNKAMIAFLDGKKPSVVFHGYNRADNGAFYRVFTAWDYRNGAISQRWTFAHDQSVLPGAEGHQLRIADVDNDGKDEICDIGQVIDDDGKQLFYNELTHGDRFHIADMDPDRPGLETYAIQQNNPTMMATSLYDSGTGKMIKKWYANGLVDVGRGIALDLASAHRGYEMYSTQPGIFNAKGQRVYENNVWAPEGLWWDGDLGREFIDGAGSGAFNPVINKFNATTGVTDRLWTLYNDNGTYSTTQAYGGRPAFWGDILGDWREELVLVASNYSELRIYTTAVAASNRLYCLMENPQYRCQATTKGYVQASYVDYYLGYNMPATVPPPANLSTDLTWNAGSEWDVGLSTSWKTRQGANAVYAQGAGVMFDVSGSNVSSVALKGTLAPAAVSFFNPQDYTLNGSAGSLTGGMTFSKSGKGRTIVTGTHAYTGATTLWDGALEIQGQLSGSPVTVWGGTWGGPLARGLTGGRLAGNGTLSQPVTLQYRGAITPGSGMGHAATLNLASSLAASDGSVMAFDLSDDPSGGSKSNDRISVAGNLSLSGTVTLFIRALDKSLAPGVYRLLTYGGTLTGSISNLAVVVPDGTPYTLSVGSGVISLNIPVTRTPANLTWKGGANGNAWDLANTVNWLNSGASDIFVSGDAVTFDGSGNNNSSANLTTSLPVSGVTVNTSGNYTFSGAGAISGSGGLTKSGSGTLTLANTNTYTGPTVINGGILQVDNLNDAGSPSSIGAADASASNLVLDGGTLSLTGLQTSTNRSITLGTAGGALSVPASVILQIQGSLTGTGSLTKTGEGTVILAASNSHSGGTFINNGTITLASDSVNVSGLGSGLVTLNGGTLSMTNSTEGSSSPVSAWSLNVPVGSWGRLNADGRCTLSGSLTGGGNFVFYTPFVRTDLTGNWSSFSGKIEVISDADGGDFRIKNTSGYAGAHLDLGNLVYAFYNNTGSNLTIPVGALSGSATSTLAGGLSSGSTITWQIGARNNDTTYSGTIRNGTGPSALTKVGTGTLTLAGTSSYTGNTIIVAGRLIVAGGTSGSNYTVQTGGTLGGSGSITGNVTLQAGAALQHGPSGGGPLSITGNLSLPSTVTVRPATSSSPTVGNYAILTYSGSLTGSPTFVWDAPGSNLKATFSSSEGVISMSLEEPPRVPGPITWTGSKSFNWDSATNNWAAGGVETSYRQGDSPMFTDSGDASSAINLVANVEPVEGVVDSTKNYTFSGSGVMTGSGFLRKSGSGRLTLTGGHSLSGLSSVSGGILALTQTGSGTTATSASLGNGGLLLSGGGNFQMGSTDGKNFPSFPMTISAGSSGTLSSVSLTNAYGGRIAGSSDSQLTLSGPISMNAVGVSQFQDFEGLVVIPTGSQLRFSASTGTNSNGNGGASTTFQVDGTLNVRNSASTTGILLGALTGGGTIQGQSVNPAGVTLYQIGAKNLNTVFSGVIANGSLNNSSTAVSKVGSGELTLAATHTYTGSTNVSGGKLVVTGSLGATATRVETTGAIGGTGTIGGAVTCNGSLQPGVSLGTLSLRAGLILASTSKLDYELGEISDRTAVTGNLTLDGTINVTAAPGFAAGSYSLITYTGSLTNNTLVVGSMPSGFTATVNTSSAGVVRLDVTALNTPPQITAGPLPSANPVAGKQIGLSVTATDDEGEAGLTYLWSVIGPQTVTFTGNGTNSAKSTTATFNSIGSHTLQVTVTDTKGLSTSGEVVVVVNSTPTVLSIHPNGVTLAVNESAGFNASVFDQFGSVMVNQPVLWSVNGGGFIATNGWFTATHAGSTYQVSAFSGDLSDAVPVRVTKALAAVSLDGLSTTYDGQPKTVTAITSPAALDLVVLYDGSSTPPKNAGSYSVSASIHDPNYSGSATGTLVIAKANAVVSLSGLEQRHDGTPRAVTITTTPAGLKVNVTYQDSNHAPSEEGVYEVVATVDDANHSGSTSGQLVIVAKSFNNWVAEAFSEEQIAAGESAPDADPDHDGLSNLAEYALDTLPYRWNSLPPVEVGPTSMTMTFLRPAGVRDVTYRVESSSDFINWQPLEQQIQSVSSEQETVSASYIYPNIRPSKVFLRIRFIR
jgi:fibronectin-binding autotransporter adhesin